jgi:hypothetical protein
VCGSGNEMDSPLAEFATPVDGLADAVAGKLAQDRAVPRDRAVSDRVATVLEGDEDAIRARFAELLARSIGRTGTAQ